MAKTKKASKRPKVNPSNLERYLLICLLAMFLISSAVLIARSQSAIDKTEIGEPSAVLERRE